MNLLEVYDQEVGQQHITHDPAQREVVHIMQEIIDNMYARQQTWWFLKRRCKAIHGLYLYGTVGIGKTYLVDLFFNYVPVNKKVRFHFHHFMQYVDKELRKAQGVKNPLRVIAHTIAHSAQVLCFDEFLVSDVTTALILTQLLPELSAQNVLFIISSNTAPKDLYLNGVQRNQFLPVIDLLINQCTVIHLKNTYDYRSNRVPASTTYVYPLNEKTHEIMEQQFAVLAGKEPLVHGCITIQKRDIAFYKCSGSIIWFSFATICHIPRSQLDYLEVAARFDTVFISDVPSFAKGQTASIILFIYFIDVMYDCGIHVFISAAVPLEQLLVTGELQQPFQRTLSRLKEMQSIDYLKQRSKRINCDII